MPVALARVRHWKRCGWAEREAEGKGTACGLFGALELFVCRTGQLQRSGRPTEAESWPPMAGGLGAPVWGEVKNLPVCVGFPVAVRQAGTWDLGHFAAVLVPR